MSLKRTVWFTGINVDRIRAYYRERQSDAPFCCALRCALSRYMCQAYRRGEVYTGKGSGRDKSYTPCLWFHQPDQPIAQHRAAADAQWATFGYGINPDARWPYFVTVRVRPTDWKRSKG
jgi:hypothetical protein